MSILEKKDLKINFDRLEREVLEDNRDKILYQFKLKPVLDQLLQCLSINKQELYDCCLEVLEGRTIYAARGYNLDVIGEIVGRNRKLSDASNKLWFHPDRTYTVLDDNPVWVEGVAIQGNEKEDDETYRAAILAKIFKNHIKYCSLPEIRYFCKLVTGITVSFVHVGIMRLALTVPIDTDIITILKLKRTLTDERIDSYYDIPIPATVELDDEVFYKIPLDDFGQGCSFTPDSMTGRVDYGRFTMPLSFIG